MRMILLDNKLKKCRVCKIQKPITDFSSDKTRKDNLNQKCKQCSAEFKKAPKNVYSEYKRSAKKRGLQFDIPFNNFILFSDSPCYYCGEELDQIRLDRVDNNLGYILSNVKSCCWKCNNMKSSLNDIEFLEHVSKILLHQEGMKNGK